MSCKNCEAILTLFFQGEALTAVGGSFVIYFQSLKKVMFLKYQKMAQKGLKCVLGKMIWQRVFRWLYGLLYATFKGVLITGGDTKILFLYIIVMCNYSQNDKYVIKYDINFLQ